MANPTNADIMQTLGRIEEKVDAVQIQATKTNGRVTSIEEWKNGIQAVEQYKKEQAPTIAANAGGTIVVQQKWFQNERLVSGVVALLLATAAVLSFFAGKTT